MNDEQNSVQPQQPQQPQQPLLVLLAGPYRSGTGGDPEAMAANLARLEEAAWPVFAAGHIPMIGEWVALPVLRSAGAGPTDPLAEQVLYPTAERLLARCDAVLRLPGASAGADADVATALRRGLPVYHDVAEIPRRVPAADERRTPAASGQETV
ncbi:DUF4406 domain-containing protein [Streptomyces sp. VRA16 Mangrove soil]|uniref:DUF4406 domain-containing protein n=1 Tax=Streptomyces sp. VRA16 Mangrove soil TaxID=2817434 RepID=UPI001A9F553C|nr:DUF4406 domain-containing protein [Streptomyces sp. VRA16 Mangrove soil]MBO1336463.1 DUF4406 domain-containing protein [Streptomyces sp. VRA16 Mangrove soil]